MTQKISLFEVPLKKRPCVFWKSSSPCEANLFYVEKPQKKNLLYFFKENLHLQLVEDLKEDNHVVYVNLDDVNPWELSILLTKSFDIFILPYGHVLGRKIKEKTKGKTLFLYYESTFDDFNWLIPLDKKSLKKKVASIRNFHISQVKRNPFDQITESLSSHLKKISPKKIKGYGLEAFSLHQAWQKEDKSIPFKIPADYSMVVIAPHPDDAEIAMGGMLSSSSFPITVFNATSGSRSKIYKEDMLETKIFPPSLEEDIQNLPSGEITRPQIKTLIRAFESKSALFFLNPYVSLKSLNLEFYENKMLTTEDFRVARAFVSERIEHESETIVFFMPFLQDAHETHRLTTNLFQKVVIEEASKTKRENIYIAYYYTPWTGSWNLYDYGKTGSEFVALVGQELLLGSGGGGGKFLGGSLACRYFVSL